MAERQKVWFITGISRGLGRALAEAVLAAGDSVIGTTRDGAAAWAAGHERLHALPLDLGDRSAIGATVARAAALHGRLDVVVNNAGYGLLGAVEEVAEDDAERLFAINFFGPLSVIRAALPVLRAQGRGHIVNITSIAGLAPLAGSGVYAASKCALEGLSVALAQELAPLGLKVTLVEPGAFRTDFLSEHSIRRGEGRVAAYGATAHATLERLDRMAGRQPGDPARAARAIIAAVQSEAPPLHLVLGPDAIRRTRDVQAALGRELDAWEAVGAATDFPAAAAMS